MHHSRLTMTLTILLLTAWVTAPSLASPRPQDEEIEGEAEEVQGPGDPQSHLAATVGEWNMAIRVWTHPEGEPVETSGSATSHWILGENFVQTRLAGEVLGSPFEGLRIEGYDAVAERFVSTWRDSRGTYTLVFRGQCDATCGIRTMSADFIDPASKTELRIKSVTTLLSADSYKYESYIVTPDGTELKNMELEATRKP